MDKFVRPIISKNKLFAISFIVITILLVINLPKITVRNSVRDLLSGNQDTYINYENFLRDFGGNATIIVELENFSDQNLLRSSVSQLVQKINGSISLNNMVVLAKIDGQSKSYSPEKLDALFSNQSSLTGLLLAITPQNSNHFTESNKHISIHCATIECENVYFNELVNRLQVIISEHQNFDGNILIYGSTVFNEILKKTMTMEMLKFFLLSLLLVSFASILFLSCFLATLITLAALITGLVWSFSILAISNIPISGALQLSPFFILVVGTCYIIHILTVFYKKWSVPDVGKEEAIIQAYITCGPAISGAALTTLLGFLSFCLIDVRVIAHLGFISAVGTLCMTLIALVYIPALLSLLSMNKVATSKMGYFFDRINAVITFVVKKMALLAIKHNKKVIGAALLLVVFSIANFQHLRFVYNPIDWLPHNSELGEISRAKITSGEWNYVIELVIDSNEPEGFFSFIGELFNDKESEELFNDRESEGLFNDKFLTNYETILASLKANQEQLEIVNISSIYDALPENTHFDKLLKNNAAIKDDLFYSYVDQSLQKTKIQLMVPWSDHNLIISRVKTIETFMHKVAKYPFHFTGKPIILGVMAKNMINSINYGYLFALITVFIVMFALLQTWKLGFLCLFPNLLPIIIILGILGFLGIPLDVLLLLVSTIILSISVDDTLHLFLHMKKYLAEHEDYADSVVLFNYSLEDVGFSIVATSSLIALSFGIFAFSSVPILQSVGLVIALGALLALIADIVLVPALYEFISFRKIW